MQERLGEVQSCPRGRLGPFGSFSGLGRGFGVYLLGELLGHGCSGPFQPVLVLWVNMVLFLVKKEIYFCYFVMMCSFFVEGVGRVILEGNF